METIYTCRAWWRLIKSPLFQLGKKTRRFAPPVSQLKARVPLGCLAPFRKTSVLVRSLRSLYWMALFLREAFVKLTFG